MTMKIGKKVYLFKVGLYISKPLLDAALNVSATLTDVSHNCDACLSQVAP